MGFAVSPMSDRPWLAIGWEAGALTGWGQFGAHFARTAHAAGHRVVLLGQPVLAGVLPTDRPLIQSLVGPLPEGDGWLMMAVGNALEAKPEGLPERVKVAGVIFCEDTGVFDEAGVAKLNAYDVIVAGSRWTERVLKEKGVERVILAHQGYDERVFLPRPDPFREMELLSDRITGMREIVRRPLVFSGGKLEFRKGQDIVVEAFKRFRATPEGKDAVLVTAWDNQWPQTMDGLWLSGYVKGVPQVKSGRLDVVPWLVANGLPAESVIDCGRLSPPELAQVMRACTVGVFPNRAESGNNLVLAEALGTGLPCIVSGGHGHDDVWRVGLEAGGEVPAGCRLYKSAEGWTETSVAVLADYLLKHAIVSPWAQPQRHADYWSWSVRGPAMAEAILACVPAIA